MTQHRVFPIAVVLTAYHNKMCCKFDELRDLLDYMTGTRVGLWEIPRARVACAAAIGRHFPWIPEMAPPLEFRTDQSAKYVRQVCKDTGYEELAVPPLRKGAYKPIGLSEMLAR